MQPQRRTDGSFSETLPPINPPASSTQNKCVRRERQKENTVSNIDKVLEHLNKKQKVTTSALDAIEMLMLGHAKTIKTFSPRRQATAKQQISNIIGNLEMDQIDENENYHGSRSTNQHVIHHEDRDYPATTDQHVVNYRSNNEDVVYMRTAITLLQLTNTWLTQLKRKTLMLLIYQLKIVHELTQILVVIHGKQVLYIFYFLNVILLLFLL